jgi:hypothetical protein
MALSLKNAHVALTIMEGLDKLRETDWKYEQHSSAGLAGKKPQD